MADGCEGLRQLDPVQGLVDYVEDIKPYHSKIVEVLIEYVSQDFVNVSIGEQTDWDILLTSDYGDVLELSTCDPGYGTTPYGGPQSYPIISPNQGSITSNGFVYGFGNNSFTVPGDLTETFRPDEHVTITAFIEDHSNLHVPYRINTGASGSGSFEVQGDVTSSFSVGNNFEVIGAQRQKSFTITSINYNGGDDITTIDVQQAVTELDLGTLLGLTHTIDSNNSGTFTIIESTYDHGMIDSWPDITDYTTYQLGNDPHTVVTVNHTFTTPPVSPQQTYVASAYVGLLEIDSVYGYSTRNKSENSPDEGTNKIAIDSVDGNNNQITVTGNLQNSNLQINDTVTITEASDNNGQFQIQGISYDQQTNQTSLTISPSIDDVASDLGYLVVQIPSNVFVVSDDFRSRFTQGVVIDVIGGSLQGTYTVVRSDYHGGKTFIRVHETLLPDYDGRDIVTVTSNNELVVNYDVSTQFTQGTTITITNSDGNNGSYIVASPGATYDINTGQTTIPLDPTLPMVQTANGQVFVIEPGLITEHIFGYGETSPICNLVPETHIDVSIIENLRFDGLGLDLSEDIIAYNLENTDTQGYDLPLGTIIAASQPSVPEQISAPTSPNTADLWFDTSTNIFRQYIDSMWQPVVTAYWLDTSEAIMYYRTKNKNIDTGWVLFLNQSPEYSAVIPADSTANTNAYVDTFSLEPHTVYHHNVTVDVTNNAYILAGGNWLERFSPSKTLTGYNNGIGSTNGELGTWQIDSFPVIRTNSVDSFSISGDLTWLFTSGRYLSIFYGNDGITYTFTVDTSQYDGVDDITTITTIESFSAGHQTYLENPIPILAIDSVSETIDVQGDVGDRYSPGSTIVIDNSTTANNGQWIVNGTSYNSGNDVTTITVTGDIPDTDLTGSATIQTYVSNSHIDMISTISGAVFDPQTSGTGPYDTGQPKTIVSVTSSVDSSVDAITYRHFGPLHISLAQRTLGQLNVTTDDKMYLSGQLFETVSSLNIVDTDASINTFRLHYTDPQTGLDVDLTDRFTPGTIFTVAGSFSDANPASRETNDAMYVTTSTSFDVGTGDTVVTIETDFSNIPPYNTFTVTSASNTSGAVPSTITLSGDQTNIFYPHDRSKQFRLSEPLVSNTQLENVITVVNATFDGSETTLKISEELLDPSFTGSLDVVAAEYRAAVYYDETNTTSPWVHGYAQLNITPIDENITAATITDILDFGWGGTERWQIISTDQPASTVTVNGDLTSILDQYDQVRIKGSDGNDDDYEVLSVVYDGGLNQSVVELYKPTIPTDPPSDLQGYLEADALDITNWFQFLIDNADATNDIFFIIGDITPYLQQGQQFVVYGTSNDGLYKVSSNTSPSYDSQTRLTQVPVDTSFATINNDQQGGWIQSYRDFGMFVTLEDMIGISIAEVSEAALLDTAGSMVGAWDYDYFDIGSFDESLGTVIHLYSNTFTSY